MPDSDDDGRKASPKARLRKTLIDEVQGKRTCVLVLGDGLNLQAGEPSGRGSAGGWNRVLETVWREAQGAPDDFNGRNLSAISLWSAVVRQWSACHAIDRTRSERAVRVRVCLHFKSIESARKPPSPLYRKLLDGRFASVVSFSVDLRLVLHSGTTRVVHRGARSSFLGRHIEVSGSRGPTKVWYPYGETSQAQSIQIGHSTYDDRLRQLEAYRADLMERNNKWDYGYGPGLLQPNVAYGDLWARPRSWCDLFFTAPLVFIGTSLPIDDWPLWWLLHQRARYFVPFKDWEHPETFFLATRATIPDHLRNGAAGIEIVTFRNHDTMWRFLEDSIDARGVDLHPGFNRKFA